MHIAPLIDPRRGADPSGMVALLLTACLGMALGSGAPAWADQSAERPGPQAISFDIAAQPLEAALDAYGAASGVQVLYQTALTSGRRSANVQGLFTPKAALAVLLAGTGLAVRYTTEDSYTLVPQAAVASPRKVAAPPDMATYGRFLGQAQARILEVLCRSAETRPGGYRITLKFWLDPSGAVLRSVLLDSTGSAQRDETILDALAHTRVGDAPPAQMPQPITMVIAARPPDLTGDCAAGP